MKRKRQKRPLLVVYVRKLISSAEDHTYEVCHLAKDELSKVRQKLKKMKDLMEVRIESGEVIAGVVEEKHDDIWDYDSHAHPEDAYSSGNLTKKVENAIEQVLGRRLRIEFVEEMESLGELIFGEDWKKEMAFTEEEREALSY